MRKAASLIIAIFISVGSHDAMADDEITLFNERGKADAYISIEDEMTIYLWTGKPVAYLDGDNAGGFHIYGFNGKHLGWFVSGIVRDHAGNAACAVKERMATTDFESFNAFKQFKPFKSFKEFAPFRPLFTKSWGDAPCRFLLGEGGK